MDQIAAMEPDKLSVADLIAIGDRLRDENERASCNAPGLILMCNAKLSGLDEKVILATLRVLVNLAADNDRNRDQMLLDNELWDIVGDLYLKFENDDVTTRLSILLNQFVHSDRKQENLERLFKLVPLSKIYRKILFSCTEFKLFLAELIKANMSLIMRDNTNPVYVSLINDFLEEFESTISELDTEFDDSSEEEVDSLADTLVNLTLFEDIDIEPVLMYRVFRLLGSEIPKLTNVTKIKKKLFAISGNISSMKSIKINVKTTFDYFLKSTDPYVVSATAITLGNYVTSKERSEEFVTLFQDQLEEFTNKLMKTQITDIIQLQSYSCLTKILNVEICGHIVRNYKLLVSTAELVKVNSQYYPLVRTVFVNFIKKFVQIQFVESGEAIDDYDRLWRAVDDNGVNVLLIRAIRGHGEWVGFGADAPQPSYANLKGFVRLILTDDESTALCDDMLESFYDDHHLRKCFAAFSGQKSSVNEVLEMIKSLSVWLKRKPRFGIHVMKDLYIFMDVLMENLTYPKKDYNTERKVLLNNAKYLSHAIIEYMHEADDHDRHLYDLCQRFLRKKYRV